MAIQTIHSTVTFDHPFTLGDSSEAWPAGRYEIETDEEDLDSVSIRGRRRLRTIIYRRDPARGTSEAMEVGPAALDAALRADAARTAAGAESVTVTMAQPRPMAASVAVPATSGPRVTPVWAVPLALGLLILLGALYGPFPPTGAGPDPAIPSKAVAAPAAPGETSRP